jgi:aryl carrier-like protein
MIPHVFVILTGANALPLTPNGKLDRRAIPNAGTAAAEPAQPSGGLPRNQTERIVADVWREVLGLKTVGIHDNFFDVGGNSVAIIRVHSELRKRLEMDIPVTTLFKSPTISLLSEDLSQGRPDDAGAEARARAKQQTDVRQRRHRRGKP